MKTKDNNKNRQEKQDFTLKSLNKKNLMIKKRAIIEKQKYKKRFLFLMSKIIILKRVNVIIQKKSINENSLLTCAR